MRSPKLSIPREEYKLLSKGASCGLEREKKNNRLSRGTLKRIPKVLVRNPEIFASGFRRV
jgi:hypothetical protein